MGLGTFVRNRAAGGFSHQAPIVDPTGKAGAVPFAQNFDNWVQGRQPQVGATPAQASVNLDTAPAASIAPTSNKPESSAEALKNRVIGEVIDREQLFAAREIPLDASNRDEKIWDRAGELAGRPSFQEFQRGNAEFNQILMSMPGAREHAEEIRGHVDAGAINFSQLGNTEQGAVRGLDLDDRIKQVDGLKRQRLIDLAVDAVDPNASNKTDKIINELNQFDQDTGLRRWAEQDTVLNRLDMNIPDRRMAGEAVYMAVLDGDININDLNPKQFGALKGYKEDNSFRTQEDIKRLAGDKIDQVIGNGVYGVVYPSDNPGYVIKAQGTTGLKGLPHENRPASGEAEVNAILEAEGLHMGPEIKSLTTKPNGDTQIEMRDISENYANYEDYVDSVTADTSLTPQQAGRKLSGVELKLNRQLAEFADRGFILNDRHRDNVHVNKMTGTPLNLDFGLLDKAGEFQQLQAIEQFVGRGFEAAGMQDMGVILTDTIVGLANKGDMAGAMDVARQGLAKLKEIDRPLKEDLKLFDTTPDFGPNQALGMDLVNARIDMEHPRHRTTVSPFIR